MSSVQDSMNGLPDTSGTLNSQSQGNTDLLNSYKQQNADLLGRYTGAINSQPTLTSLYGSIGQQYNLPTLQANANQLNDTVSQIPYTQLNAARGEEMSQNQLDRGVGYQQAKLSPLAERATTQAQNAQNLVSTQLGLEQQQQQKELQPYSMESTLLGQQQGYGVSLQSQQNTNELNTLLAKMQAGVQLSTAEADRANQLAISEQQLNSPLAQAQAQYYTSSKSYIPAGNGLIFDASTRTFVGSGNGAHIT
jgi:hypothetical protein